MTAANITPTALTDGVLYASAVPLTSTEADLYGGTGANSPDPVPVVEGQTVVAVVQFSTNGHVSGNNSYVFMQTDLGDGNWIDVAWCQFNKADQSSPLLYVLCGGGLGAMNNAFGPQRRSGSAPPTQGNGSNAVPLGGRVRFTGLGIGSGGSSSLAGTYAGTLVTITYKLQQPR